MFYCICVLCCIRPRTPEYMSAMATIEPVVSDHKSKLMPGVPQLNKCDNAVQVCLQRSQLKGEIWIFHIAL